MMTSVGIDAPGGREGLGALARQSKLAATVYSYMMLCVNTGDGWTFGLTFTEIARVLGTTRQRVAEAIDLCTQQGLILALHPDGRKTRYQMVGASFQPSPQGTLPDLLRALRAHIPYLEGTLSAENAAKGALAAPLKSLVDVVESLLQVVADQQQPPDSYAVPPGHASPPKRAARAPLALVDVPPGHVSPSDRASRVRLPAYAADGAFAATRPAAHARQRRQREWLEAFGVQSPEAVHKILDAGWTDDQVLGWMFEFERRVCTGALTGGWKVHQLVLRLEEGPAAGDPPAPMLGRAREALGEDPGAYTVEDLREDLAAIAVDAAQSQRFSGKYSDYIER